MGVAGCGGNVRWVTRSELREVNHVRWVTQGGSCDVVTRGGYARWLCKVVTRGGYVRWV